MKKVYLLFLIAVTIPFFHYAQKAREKPPTAAPWYNPNSQDVVLAHTCGNPKEHPFSEATPEANKDITQALGVQAAPYGYTESIHNAIAKFTPGTVDAFRFGTTPGAQNIRWGQGLSNTSWNTGGHSYEELRRSAAAMGTNFNIGDNFYLSLYKNNSLVLAIPLTFQWEDLGLPSHNLSVSIETTFGVNGAPAFTAQQAAKMQGFYDLVIPIIRSVYGPPSRSHTVTVINDSYATGSNTYYNGPDWISTSYAVNSSGDLAQPRLMIHELIHAWRGNVCISSDSLWHYKPTLSGFEEGCAEGVAIIVMDLFMAQYPNYFIGPQHKIHWNQEPGMPFEWYYDFNNHPQITNVDFWSSDQATGSHWLRYGMGAAAIKKIWIEDHDALKKFNAEYYARMNANHTLIPERNWIVNAFVTVKPFTERTPMLKWMNEQHIFDCTNVLGKKVFMLSFAGLSWNAFQYDNRIHFMETHKNGLEWIWDSQDQAGQIEVSNSQQPNWSWTHQLNNVPGDISIVRDWNNTNSVAARPICNNSHWVNELPSPLNPSYVGTPLLGPYQGPNPYYVGSVFTRDHEQNNCTAVPGCGKRAWAIGNQPLYTTSSSLTTMWPTPTMINGTGTANPKYPQYLRYINDLTESGLFRYEIGFNDPKGSRVNDMHYRLLGNNFINVKGVVGGIYSSIDNQVDGKLYIEHENYGPEAAATISNNSFKINRLWTSILATQQQYMNGRTDVHYAVPGKVHAVYINPDCSKKKIDFRTTGYGDGLYGTEMLLFKVEDFEDIKFTTTPDLSICPGDPIHLGITNNFPDIFAGDPRVTYTWKDPAGNTISTDTIHNIASATAAQAGIYTVSIGFFGCPPMQQTVKVIMGNGAGVQVTAPDSLSACLTDTIHLTASTTVTGATYSWTGPASFTSTLQNPIITPVTAANAGQYIVAVTAQGCTGTLVTVYDTVHVKVISNATLNLTAHPDLTICLGDNLQLSTDQVAGATYSWSGPNSFSSNVQNPLISSAGINASGQYIVTVRITGCGGITVSDKDTIDVTVNTSATLSISPQPDITVCTGDVIQLNATTVNGATYNWTGPSAFTSSQQNPGIIAAAASHAGTYIVTVSIVGCGGVILTRNDTIVVAVNPTVTLSVSPQPDMSVCEGASIQLTTGTVAGASYSWKGPLFFSSTLQNPLINPATMANAGQYIVTVSLTGCNGVQLIASDTIDVVVKAIGTLNIVQQPDQSVCVGAILQLSSTTVSGATYSWTGPNAFSSSQQNPVINPAVLASAGQYIVTVTGSGCGGILVTAQDTIMVGVQANPVVTAVVPNAHISLCEKATLNLSVNPVNGATYNWTGPGSFTSLQQQTSIQNVSATHAGIYTVMVSVNGCGGSIINATATVTVNITSNPAINITPYSILELCPGSTATLSVNSIIGATYNWTGPAFYTSTQAQNQISNISAVNAGIYTVQVHLVNSCMDTMVKAQTELKVKNINGITLSLSGEQKVCENEVLHLSSIASSAPNNYNWLAPNGAQISNTSIATINNFSAADSGNYVLTVNYGCPGLDVSSTIHVALEDREICHPESGYFLPNIFSPNGDGKNDVLYLYGSGIESMSLSIYDRWGQLVFYSNNQTYGWNGTYKGELLNSAVFAYRLSIKLSDKEPVETSGNISLIR